jgi:hypothetical protein
VTAQGLRFEFANDLYESVAGARSPVRGGSDILDKARDEQARFEVTRALGHSRIAITGAYVGGRRRGRPPGGTSAAGSEASPT